MRLQTWHKYYFESLFITFLNAVLKSNYKISTYSFFFNQRNIPETLIQTHDTKWFDLLDYKPYCLNIAKAPWRL